MNGVRAELLAVLPASIEDAVSANILAARADIAHHIVRQHLAALVEVGTVATTDHAGIPRYFRKMEEDVGTRYERILSGLPENLSGAETITEISERLGIPSQSVRDACRIHLNSGLARRDGRGGPTHPFRFYRAPAAPTPADVLDLVRGAEEAENEATTSSVAADRDDAGTEVTPDPEPPGAIVSIDADGIESVPLAPGDEEPDELAAAYKMVIGDVLLRAVEAEHDAKILDAAAKLLRRIHRERLEP
jgi:predicted ArsR family transcriptional regulator